MQISLCLSLSRVPCQIEVTPFPLLSILLCSSLSITSSGQALESSICVVLGKEKFEEESVGAVLSFILWAWSIPKCPRLTKIFARSRNSRVLKIQSSGVERRAQNLWADPCILHAVPNYETWAFSTGLPHSLSLMWIIWHLIYSTFICLHQTTHHSLQWPQGRNTLWGPP